MSDSIKILCLGDIVARPGRDALRSHLADLKKQHSIDFTIVNAENACGGVGLDAKHAFELKELGIDVLTMGDHTWSKKDIYSVFSQNPAWIIRPHNYPIGAPGLGETRVRSHSGIEVRVVNLLGRVFMDGLWDCPFMAADKILDRDGQGASVTIFDFHAEASSEKIAFGRYVDGRASIVFGTHTHVQTADETILPGGTAYITDLGMCGSSAGVIGMEAATALFRFTSGRPKYYEAAEGEGSLRGVICEINVSSGKATSICRVQYPLQP